MAAHLKRHQKDVATAKAETVSGPDVRHFRNIPDQDHQRARGRRCLFAADDGTVAVWMLRYIDTGGKRRTFASLLHGTMASGMARRSGCRSASLAGKSFVWRAMAVSPCCSATF